MDPVTGRAKGIKQDSRTFKTHSLKDKKEAFHAAEQKVEEAAAVVPVEAEIEEISASLSATVLADRVSGPSEDPMASLWSRDSSFYNDSNATLDTQSSSSVSSDPSHRTHPHSLSRDSLFYNGSNATPDTQSPSSVSGDPSHPHSQARPRRSREAQILLCLSDIEVEVNAFLSESKTALTLLGLPSIGAPTQFPLLNLFDTLDSLKNQLDCVKFKSPAVLELKDSISRKLLLNEKNLTNAKKQWMLTLLDIKTINTPIHGLPYETCRFPNNYFCIYIHFYLAHHFKPILEGVDPVLQVMLFMVTTCHVLLGISHRGCTFLLNMVQYVLHLALFRVGLLSQEDEKLLSNIPSDPRAAKKAFSLPSKNTTFAVCPNSNCHFNYKPSFKDGSPIPTYPKICSHREFPGGQKCGTTLLKPRVGPRCVQGQTVEIPIKPFIAFSFKDWLGGILARSGFEEKMDKVWKDWKKGSEMKDIFDGEILQNFTGPDGQHFSDGGNEGRYVFSLCVDYFNPLGNKQAGKKKSVGLISIVCLNLPPELRYKPENMFLFGVVPGPHEPPLTCLNHYLSYLIDELLEFWHTGIRYSRTNAFYFGRVVRCALVCLVCDLPAARKTNGFASLKHSEMCAICRCKFQPKTDNLNDSFSKIWERRTGEEIRNSAQIYIDAANEKERNDTVQTTGIRWSELYRLPYFDPSRFVVVDAMHNLFLGLIQEHFDILGIRSDQKTPEKTPSLRLNIPNNLMTRSKLNDKEQKSLDKLICMLEEPITRELRSTLGYDKHFKRFSTLHSSALEIAYTVLDIPFVPVANGICLNKKMYNKADYIRSILAWVSLLFTLQYNFLCASLASSAK